MQNQKRQSIFRNAFFSLLAWILPLVLSFVATPLILNRLGKKEYGIYVLILGFISYSFSFSIGRSITKYVAEYQTVNDNQKIGEVISTVIVINAAVCATVIIVMTIFARWFVTDILALDVTIQQETINGLYIAAFVITATILGQIYSAVIQALHRFDIYSTVLVVTNVISIAGNILIVLADYKIRELLIWNLLTTIATTGIFYYYAASLLPNYQFSFKISREMLIRIVKYNSAIVVMQFFSNLLVLFERTWITGKYGAEKLTDYIIPMTLSMMIHMFIGSFIIVIFPVASESHALGDRQEILIIYKKATKIVLALTAFMALTLLAGRYVILMTWLGANFDQASADILIFHTLTFSILAVSTVFWQIAEGFGYPHLTALLSIIWLIVSVPLMIVFSQNQTITSLAAARFLGVLIFIPAVLFIERKIFGASLWKFWRKTLILGAVAVIVTYLIEYEIFEIFSSQLTALLTAPLTGGLVFGLFLYFTRYFDREEINWFWGLKDRLF